MVKVHTALMVIRQADESEMIETNLSTIGNSLLWGRGSMRDEFIKKLENLPGHLFTPPLLEILQSRWKAQDTASTS